MLTFSGNYFNFDFSGNYILSAENLQNSTVFIIISFLIVWTLRNSNTFVEIKNNELESVQDSIKNTLLSNKRNQLYNNWLRSEKKNLEIVDLRYKIF